MNEFHSRPTTQGFGLTLLLSVCLIGATSIAFNMNEASALPFVKVGPKVGMGTGFFSSDIDGFKSEDYSSEPKAFGVGARFDLAMIQLEVNGLYYTNKIEFNGAKVNDSAYFGVPIIARFDISPIPAIGLAIGGGYEQRFLVDDDASGTEDTVSYLPISLAADFKVPFLATAGVEVRYSHALSNRTKGDQGVAVHDLMFFAHAFF